MRSVREQLEQVLRRPVNSPADAAAVAKAADALRMLLEAEAAALQAVSADEDAAKRPIWASSSLAGMTLHDAAERVLEQAGAPLHVSELGRRIKAGGWTHPRSRSPRPDQILYQLAARLPRHPDVFKRVAPNTFALVNWDQLPKRSRRARVGLFSGPGDVARRTVENEDAPFEGATWR